MGQYLDDNFTLLKKKLDEMGQLVQVTIAQALDALLSGDPSLVRQTMDNEAGINRLEREIDDLVLRLLALQHPTAIDLRFVIVSLKITNDLERMGDQGSKVSNAVAFSDGDGMRLGDPLIDFAHLGKMTLELVQNCVKAYTTDDLRLARSIVVDERHVAEVHGAALRTLVEHVYERTAPPEECLAQLLVVRSLARLADLTTSVAKNVIFYVEGKMETGEIAEPLGLALVGAE